MAKDKRTYDVLIDVWNKAEPYFTFDLPRVAKSMPATRDPWRVAPDDKKQKVHVLVGTRQSQIAIFPNAIAIGSPATGGAAEGGKLAVIAAIPALVFFFGGIVAMFTGMPLFGIYFVVLSGFFLMGVAWAIKGWLCSPKDWPIIFNRKDRTVTWAPVVRFSYWKFWSTELKQQWRTASWDDVRVRSYKYREATTGGFGFHDSYSLFLLWGGANGDPRSLDQAVSIGYQGYFEDELMWMLWEHIRRYMEEDGPAIPHGETLREPAAGKPIIYPPEIIRACGGPPLSKAEVEKLAAEAPVE